MVIQRDKIQLLKIGIVTLYYVFYKLQIFKSKTVALLTPTLLVF